MPFRSGSPSCSQRQHTLYSFMASRYARRDSGWILEKGSFHEESCCSGTAAQGGDVSLSLEVIKSCGDVALRDVVIGHGGGGLVVGLGGFSGVFQP